MDRSEWMGSLRSGDTVTVTHYQHAERGQQYATLTPQHAQVERVNTQHVTVLGQRFRISWAGGSSGHSTSGPHARLTPAADLPALQLEARRNAALNVLLPLERTETRWLESRMQLVPHTQSGVITVEIVEALERAVAALATLKVEVETAANEIDARAEAWWASVRRA